MKNPLLSDVSIKSNSFICKAVTGFEKACACQVQSESKVMSVRGIEGRSIIR